MLAMVARNRATLERVDIGSKVCADDGDDAGTDPAPSNGADGGHYCAGLGDDGDGDAIDGGGGGGDGAVRVADDTKKIALEPTTTTTTTTTTTKRDCARCRERREWAAAASTV